MKVFSVAGRYIIALLIVAVCAAAAVLVSRGVDQPGSKFFLIKARQYEYDPPVIHVSRGDTVHIKLVTLDVVHGFFLEGHDIDAHVFPSPPHMAVKDAEHPDGFRDVDEIVFVAHTSGKFRFRCSQTCGPLHPFMQGEMIVGPNDPYHAGIGAAIGILLAGLFLLYRPAKTDRRSSS